MRGGARPRWNNLPLGVFVCAVGLFFLLAPARSAGAAPAGAKKGGAAAPPGFGKYKVVRINPDGILPRLLRVENGATVIWLNATDAHSTVVFNEGELLQKSTGARTLFFLAPDGTYVSSAFGPGATASTAFIKKGAYKYFVTGLPVSEEAAFAQIIVE